MTDAQLIAATLWTLFAVACIATVFVLEYVLNRMERIFCRSMEAIERRLSAIDQQLGESNRSSGSIAKSLERFND